uniref:Uncharacterized protein n=1 Tax=Macaca fascicularis TaxID=9541 RepID=A0A7N9CUR4_MACFA
VCWVYDIDSLYVQNYGQALTLCCSRGKISRVHVHNMQVCYICIHVPCWCAAPINLSFPLGSSFSSV